MKQLCRECGKEARPGDNICIHCGNPLKVEAMGTNNKKPMPKKQKFILRVIIGLVVFIIGFSVWANSYQSPQSIQKRFETAISKKDSSKVKKLMVHEDGSAISKQEADAFLKFVKQEGNSVVFDVTTVVEHGKFLGLYEAHKIEAVDQFASYDDLVDGLSFEFNGKKISEHEREEDGIVYGPLVPGIYTVKAVFEGEYGETTMEDTLTLGSVNLEYTLIGMEIPVSKVVFYVENYDQFDPSKAYIQLNDEEIPISDEGETDEIGPFILDGSQEVKTVITMPWGEIVSEPFGVDDTYMSINADLISQDKYKEAMATLKDFGEQYVEAMSKSSTKPFKAVSADLKEDLIMDYIYEDYYYSGKFDFVDIDKNSIYVETDSKEPVFNVFAQYTVQEDRHQLTESPDLHEQNISWSVGLSFDTKDKQWTITSLDQSGMWGDFEGTDKLEGSKKLHGPSKETIAEAENEEIELELQVFINDYTRASVEAINYRDFELVSKYITDDGPRRKEARDYIDYLDSKDIYENWYGSELEKVEKVDESTWKITVIEEFEIQKPDSSNIKEFRTSLVIKRIDNQYYVNELTETNEL